MKIVFQLLAFSALLTFGSSFTYACSCAEQTQRSRFRQSKAVFLGEVIKYKELSEVEAEENLNSFQYQVTFKVERQWKGKRQSEITALAQFDTPRMCGDLELNVGKRILIYAPYKDGQLVIYRDCSPNVPAESAKEEMKNLNNFFFRTYTLFYPFPKY